jgi:uncharacterized protein
MRKSQQELIKQISDKELTYHLYFTQILLLTISFVLSIFLFNSFSTFFYQFQLSWDIFFIGILSGIVIVLLDLCLMKIIPEKYYDDGGINKRIFSSRSISEIAFLAAVIAISEEVLFRGVIQYHFGWLIASGIFAIIHFRYFAHWFLISNVVLLSLWIGWVYEWTGNLLVTIMMHFVIDFLLGVHMRWKAKQAEKKEGISDE